MRIKFREHSIKDTYPLRGGGKSFICGVVSSWFCKVHVHSILVKITDTGGGSYCLKCLRDKFEGRS